jgi:hypothetical protein
MVTFLLSVNEGAICGAGTAHPSGAPRFFVGFVLLDLSLVFGVVFCHIISDSSNDVQNMLYTNLVEPQQSSVCGFSPQSTISEIESTHTLLSILAL